MTPLYSGADRPQEACGIVGVYSPSGSEVARRTFFALFTLQHRGQESAGLAVGDGRELRCHKRLGLITQVFHEDTIAGLTGYVAIGHTRYSTTGANVLRNSQPLEGCFRGTPFALGHNGNLVNSLELRRELEANGTSFGTSVDSEVIVRVIESSDAPDLETACLQAMKRIAGAYCLVIASPTQLIVLRDPWGVRPLALGRFEGEDGYIVASETCAFQPVGARFLREVEPGEAIVIDSRGLREIQAVPKEADALCIFEFIYFAAPHSYIYGTPVWTARRRMGHLLAAEHPAEADIVIPVPDTGVPAAIGYSERSRIPYSEGLIKNRYIQRTFIQPDQQMREQGVRMKLATLKENLVGRRVVVVDDSIVRGTTTLQQVKMLRDAGASEVHLRISSPPIRFPCYYGIDMARQEEFIAHRMSVARICKHVGADSLGYLSLPNTVKAIGIGKDKFCRACFDSKYPCPIPAAYKATKLALEQSGVETPSRGGVGECPAMHLRR